MKKKLLLIITLSFVMQRVIAQEIPQQKPQYTQYIFNNYLLNPAVAGIENYTDVKLGNRAQWVGISGAPVTSYFSINAPLGDNFLRGDASAFPSSGGEDPSSRLFTQYYRASEPHHGVGFMVMTDKAGPITQTDLAASYAYHLGITEKLNVSVGVSAGFNHVYLDRSLIVLESATDRTIDNFDYSQWRPDVTMGVWAYSSNYYFGVSAQQLLPRKQYVVTNNSNVAYENKAVPQFFVTGGYKVFLSDDITLLPSALLKFIQPAPLTFDINLKMSFRDRFWIGGSWRKDDSYAALVGFNLSSVINVSYSYDISTSALRSVSNGSHEIVLGILLNNRYNLKSPQHGF